MDIAGVKLFKLYKTGGILKILHVLGMRKPYNDKELLFIEGSLKIKEPLHLFNEWFQIVKNDPRTVEANAMCLATATKLV